MASGVSLGTPGPSHKELCIKDVLITENILGKGAYGEVVEVIWNGTSCAGKRVHQVLIDEGSHVVQSFKRECETWSKLRHPNVAQFLGLFYESLPYGTKKRRDPEELLPMIVIEKMDTTLTHLMEDTPRDDFPSSMRVDILCQVARGMVYLHHQTPSVVHRDLTPNNILVNTNSLTVKLSDFGVAKVVKPHTNSSVSNVPGTPVFMPPEVFDRGGKITPDLRNRIDVFSYGGLIIFVLIHMWPEPVANTKMVEGRLQALDEVQRREAHINLFSPQEKSHFQGIVHQCLEYEPAGRPTSRDLLKKMESLSQLEEYKLSKLPAVNHPSLMKEWRASLEKNTRLQKELETSVAQNQELKEQLLHKEQDIEALDREMQTLRREKESLQSEGQGKDGQIQSLQIAYWESTDKLKNLRFDLEIAEEEARCVQVENRSLAEQLKLREKENRESEEKLAVLQGTLEDLERKNKLLENDFLCVTLESTKFKLSLEQEKEKQKNTLEAYDAKYNLLMETVAEKDQEINDLHEELSGYDELIDKFKSVQQKRRNSSASEVFVKDNKKLSNSDMSVHEVDSEETVCSTQPVIDVEAVRQNFKSSVSQMKDNVSIGGSGETSDSQLEVLPPVQLGVPNHSHDSEELSDPSGNGVSTKTVDLLGDSTRSRESSWMNNPMVMMRGEAYFNMPPLVEDNSTVSERIQYSREFLVTRRETEYCRNPHNCGPLINDLDCFADLAVDKEKAYEIVIEVGSLLLQPNVENPGYQISEQQKGIFDALVQKGFSEDLILSGLIECGTHFHDVQEYCYFNSHNNYGHYDETESVPPWTEDTHSSPPVPPSSSSLPVPGDDILPSSPQHPVDHPAVHTPVQVHPEDIRRQFSDTIKGLVPEQQGGRDEPEASSLDSDIRQQFRNMIGGIS